MIEGDQQTENDADRIRQTGVPAIQVNTGKGCHLDAQMIGNALVKLQPQENSLMFIENVGNLVCPSEFDLGEHAKVVILSVTEGEDKPLKYPHMFAASKLMILNKVDLLPYLNFDVEKCIAYAKQVNPTIEVIQLSSQSGEGLQQWLDWLKATRTIGASNAVVDEFRDPELAKSLLQRLQKVMENQPHFTPENPLYLMEVCGGHTHTIFKFGLDRLLPKVLNLFTVQAALCVYYRWGELMYVLRLLVSRSNFLYFR